MTEQFWKEKYYGQLDKQDSIRMAQAVNLAQNELLQTCDNAKEVLEKIKDKSIRYYEVLETLTNALPDRKVENSSEIIIPKIQ